MKTAITACLVILFIFLFGLLFWVCLPKEKNIAAPAPVSSIDQRLCGIYQIPYSESVGGGMMEKEFNSDGTYFKRSYSKTRLIWIIYGHWSCDNRKITTIVDSCFDYDTLSLDHSVRTLDTSVTITSSCLYKDVTEKTIDFFQPSDEYNPSTWETWERIK